MDHGGETARPTTVVSADDLGMAGGAVQAGGQAHMSTATFHAQGGAAAARRAGFDELARHVHAAAGHGDVPVDVLSRLLHHGPGPVVAYANIGASWQQPGPLRAVLVGPQLPDGVVPVHVNYGYSALQPRPGAGRGVVLVDPLPGSGGGGAVYDGDYALLPHPGAGHGGVLVDLLPDGAVHGDVFVGLLSGGVDAVYDNYGYYALQPHGAGAGLLPGGGVTVHDDNGYYPWQPRPGAGRGEVLIDLLHDGAGAGLLPGGGVTVHDNYGCYPWQPRPGAERGEVFIGPLPGGVGVLFDNLGNFTQQTVPSTGRADGTAGALRGRMLGVGYDGSGALAGAAYNNLGMVAENLRRLLPFAGIGACSVVVNGLAAGPGSPAVAFDLFALFLGGLLLVILHVLRA